jgi:polygalacturonase
MKQMNLAEPVLTRAEKAMPIGLALLVIWGTGSWAQDVQRVKADPAAVKEVLAGKRTEANAAWWGFNEKDSTDGLQAAIRSGAKRLIVPHMGKPWVVRPIKLESNQEIVFEKGVRILAKRGEFKGKGDCLFEARMKENITLRGPGAEFVMWKQDYRKPPYEKAEWRMCLSFRGCRNVRVLGLRLAASGGDGIYIGRGTGDTAPKGCRDVLIKDVLCDDNYRQGISVISARNLLIENCVLQNTEGTAPAAGIDFEPNKPDEYLVNCVMRNCTLKKNASYGLVIALHFLKTSSEPVSIRIENCECFRNKATRALHIHSPKEARGLVEFQGGKFNWNSKINLNPKAGLRVHFGPAPKGKADAPQGTK